MNMTYGMFTDAGNAVVANLVSMAKTYGFSDGVVMAMMNAIAKDECYAEITDTEVRECIGCALGWYE
jgi:hypothetical protein